MDIEVSRTAFGGFAFEPTTDAGRHWVQGVVERNPDYPVFRHPDPCLTGFGDDAIGVEPCDFDAFATDMVDAGIISNSVAKGA
jgi:hypothetical protein